MAMLCIAYLIPVCACIQHYRHLLASLAVNSWTRASLLTNKIRKRFIASQSLYWPGRREIAIIEYLLD